MAAVAGAGPACRNRAGNVVALDFAVGQGLPVFVCAAVGIRGSLAAGRAGREAAIDAVAVVVVGDNENALFRMSGTGAEQKNNPQSSRDRGTHASPKPERSSRSSAAMKPKTRVVKLRLR